MVFLVPPTVRPGDRLLRAWSAQRGRRLRTRVV